MDNVKEWTSLLMLELLMMAFRSKYWETISVESSLMFPMMSQSAEGRTWPAEEMGLTLASPWLLFEYFANTEYLVVVAFEKSVEKFGRMCDILFPTCAFKFFFLSGD